MKKLPLRITGLIVLMLVGGAVNTGLIAQQVSSSPILVSNKGTNDGQGAKMVSLADLLTTVEQNFEATFLFKDEMVHQKRVNADKIRMGENTGQQLSAILDQLGLTYSQVDEQTYVLLRKKNPLKKVAAQEQISGTVTDAQSGETLPGVNILVKGTSTGTSTDSEGNYELTVESLQDILVVTYVGYQRQEVPIQGRAEIDVVLQTQAILGEEMIVTALGIERKSRSLGYSVAEVQPEDITVNSTANFANTLQGKLSGVNVSPMGTGPQGSSKIRIRGQSSFGASNSPLIVVDGLPINNITYGVSNDSGGDIQDAKGSYHYSDSGDGLSSIDPDNIKSMNVLKGAAASALYGARAKDGVIIITTKNGSEKLGVQLEYNSNFTYNIPMDFRNYQMQYGQGEHGERPTNPYPVSGVHSFGERFEPGMTQILFDNEEVPYKPHPNQLKGFYRNGYKLNNSISISTGNESGSINLTLSNLKTQSIQPNSDYDKNNISLGFTQTMADRLTISGNINYSKENRNNPPSVAGKPFGVPVIYTMANSMPLDVLKANCCDEQGNEVLWTRLAGRTNPYFALKRFENNDRDRVFGNITARYDFSDWLYLQGRIGQDYFYRNVDYNLPTGSQRDVPPPPGFVNGEYAQDQQKFREINADFLVKIDKNFGNYGVDVNLGGNKMIRNMDRKNVVVDDFYQRGLYTVSNGRAKNPTHSLLKRRVNSLYGSAEVSYKDMIYLTGTARNDWFSTLSPDNRSILYPSITGSFVFSDAFRSALPEWINFGKLRASYAQVGSDTDVTPYSDQIFYAINPFTYRGNQVGGIGISQLPNANLQPMHLNEVAFGLQMTLFSNYSFEIGYYHKISYQQIINQEISVTSGFDTQSINAGESINEGIEMSINVDPIQTSNFRWNISANAAYNRSEVLSLGNNVDEITVGSGYSYGHVRQVVGKPMNQLYGYARQRDEQGRQVFNPNNGVALPSKGEVNYGSSLPNWTGGITDNFHYKNASLSFLITFMLGNKIISATDVNAWREGFDKRTLRGREQGYVVGNGVNPDGSENTTHAEVQSFYENIKTYRITEQSVYRGGSWQLRQATLGYDFTHLISNKVIKGLHFNLVANNVLVLKKWMPHTHPNQNPVVSDRAQGLVPTGLPVTRNFGFNLNVEF